MANESKVSGISPMNNARRPWLGLRARRRGVRQAAGSDGFVLPFVILAALVMSVGTLALANRSGMGFMGAVFHGLSFDAQEAAEIGMNRIIGELNRKENRGLLRSKGSTVETALWTSADATTVHSSRCPGTELPDLATNPNIGYPAGSSPPTTYNFVYVRADGSISSSAQGATRAYRLVSVTRRPEAELKIFQTMAAPAGTVTLEVEGRSLRPNGSASALSTLRRTFQLVPRCCGVSFGGAHGNVNYARPANDSTPYVCLPDSMRGLGLLGGTGNTTGSFNLTGSNAVTLDRIGGTAVSPVFCLADSAGTCNRSSSINQGIAIDLINPRPSHFPAAKTYPGNPASAAPGSLRTPRWNVGNQNFAYCLNWETSADPIDVESNNGRRCRSWAVNADVDSSRLPAYCAQTAMETSCNLASLDYSNSDVFFLTGTRKLRFYFTQAGSLLEGGSGNRGIHHCKTLDTTLTNCATPLPGTADLAFFGCNSCGEQAMDLKGTPDVVNFFVYIPNGSVTLKGTPTFKGVLWANAINSSGNVNWILTDSGTRDVMVYMGLLPPGETNNSTSNPLLFDYVARATSQYRWVNQ
jgi:hypothetical protein